MSIDVLILNTAVSDFRSDEFAFTEKLAGPGGLARCKTKDMPAYTQMKWQPETRSVNLARTTEYLAQ
jgi:hypothetical protein